MQLQRVPDLEPADHVEQRLQRHPLGVQQQLLAGVEHAQVAEHLALVGEERGVASVAGSQRFDVVGHLAGEHLLRLGAAQRELAPVGAVAQAAALRQRRVLGAEPVRFAVGCGHSFEDSPDFEVPETTDLWGSVSPSRGGLSEREGATLIRR